MRSTAIACAIAAAAMSFSSLSAAQPDRRGPGFEQRGDRQEARRDAQEARRDIREGRRDLRDARENRRDARENRRDARNDRYYNARSPEFHRGRYIPREYRSHNYYVNDWRGHRLSAPPRGHQWVQVGGDYVLIAVATGVIVNLMLR